MSVAALLASIAVFVPVPPGVHVIRGNCPAPTEDSCAYGDGRIYLSPAEREYGGIGYEREVLAHELGHVWDIQHLTDADRQHYSDVVGRSSAPWWPPAEDAGAVDFTVPMAEQFADTYALCALGPRVRARRWHRDHDYVGIYNESVPKLAVAETCWWIKARS